MTTPIVKLFEILVPLMFLYCLIEYFQTLVRSNGSANYGLDLNLDLVYNLYHTS